MKLVNEDKHGAYLGVQKEFLKEFVIKENNPNFEVYDARDNQDRFIVVKSSRLPDDEDITAGKYGINFHRAKPEFKEAKQYSAGLPHDLENKNWLRDIAFAAANEREYDKKSSVWDNFYSYIWGSTSQIIWVAPHSGSIGRTPDDILPFPKLEMDAFTAGLAASCAFKRNDSLLKRVMISIHSHNWFGAVLDLGGFGIIDGQKLADTAKKIEAKYHERVQILANECKKDFLDRATRYLQHINTKKGTLNPDELKQVSNIDSNVVQNIIKGLELYKIQITEFTLERFKEAIQSLNGIEAQVISYNYLFPAKHIGKLIKISNKISDGLLCSALQTECQKSYLKKEPELMTNIILDINNELFG